jgi:hypothetical protein
MGHVFVAGSINMDVVATADRHPRIGETVAGTAVLYFPGGKGANQAVSAAKLGAPTTLIGRLGKDAFGDQLRAFLGAQARVIVLSARWRRSLPAENRLPTRSLTPILQRRFACREWVRRRRCRRLRNCRQSYPRVVPAFQAV